MEDPLTTLLNVNTTTSEEAPLATPIVLVRQNSLSVEQIYKNGISKRVHVVVKNHPFLIQVSTSPSVLYEGQKLDFNRFPLEARLVYDNESLKEVGFVKHKPIESKVHISERGDQATVEIRPKVLTSQLEDMLFRVKIVALDSHKQPIPGVYTLSEAVKVVSKPEQVKKKKETTKVKKTPSKPKEQAPKRSLEEIMTEGLARIENNVGESERLVSMVTLLEDLRAQEALIEQQAREKKIEEAKQQPAEQLSPFEEAFKNFIAAYDKLDHFDKPQKVRKVLKNCSVKDRETLTEMADTLTDPEVIKSAKDQMHNKHGSTGGCQCQSCPHREELIRIDGFYNRFLTSDGLIF